jgi:hypothetical protein
MLVAEMRSGHRGSDIVSARCGRPDPTADPQGVERNVRRSSMAITCPEPIETTSIVYSDQNR